MSNAVLRAYYSESPLSKQSHYHDCHQIILIIEGELEFRVNGVSRIGRAGQALIFSCYENHSITALSTPYRRYVLHIDPHAHSAEGTVYSILSNRPRGFSNAVDVSDAMEDFEAVFARAVSEYDAPGKLTEDMQKLLVSQLLIMLWRRLPSPPPFDSAIAGIQKRFEENCSEAYSLESLAKELCISPSSLSHRFKKLTGRSVMDYLLSCRIAAAKKYLTETGMDIGEIVEKCGFSDSSNFSRTFKKLNGISPSEFRKKYTPE